MAARQHGSRKTLATAAVLLLPAACVLAVWYVVHEPPAETRRSAELAPAQVDGGFTPQVGLSTPMVVEGAKRAPELQVPEAIERGAAYDALQARMRQPGLR